MKILRIALLVVICLSCVTAFGLPLFGLNFIPGWPEFILRVTLAAVACPAGLLVYLLWPKKEKPDQPKGNIKVQILITAAVFVAIAGVQAWVTFGMSRNSSIEYLRSPSGRNLAVMEIWDDGDPYEHGYAYVVRARFFHQTSRIFWTSERGNRAFTWIDDGMLALVYLHRHSGEFVEEHLFW